MQLIPLFISFTWVDALDILLVAILLFQMYYLVRGTPAVSIFTGIFFIYFIWIIVRAFDMKLFGSILGKFIDVGVIAIIVVFQQEIRRFLLYLGTNEFLGKNPFMRGILKFMASGPQEHKTTMDFNPLIKACFSMSESKTGALIVLQRNSDLNFYINTGEPLDSIITERMLESIFYKNSPLHDGAVIIRNNRLVAARCVLPVTEKEQFPAHYGMRHRAAAGISESTDAIAIIVSEQTGQVSVSSNGKIKGDLNPEKLKSILEKEFDLN